MHLLHHEFTKFLKVYIVHVSVFLTKKVEEWIERNVSPQRAHNDEYKDIITVNHND